MIIQGHQYRYTARRGKLTRRYGQIVTALHCQRWEIVIRFPDGHRASVQPRFLQEIRKP